MLWWAGRVVVFSLDLGIFNVAYCFVVLFFCVLYGIWKVNGLAIVLGVGISLFRVTELSI